MAGVFISYRRNDSDVAAGRLADDLVEFFGRRAVFRDIDTLVPGEDYTDALARALGSCAALVALIGPAWSAITDEQGRRRLDDPDDWVRREIAEALRRDIRVIPVALATSMPREEELPTELQPLLRRQAVELTDRHWRYGVDVLAESLEKVPGMARRRIASRWPVRRTARYALFAVAAMLAVGVIAWFSWGAVKGGPRSPDLSEQVRIRNAGPAATVAGLAVASAMEGSLAEQDRPVTLSGRYIYEKARRVDLRNAGELGGTPLDAAVYVAERWGAPPEEMWPYVAQSHTVPPDTSWDDLDAAAKQYRAIAYPVSSYDDIPKQLALGRPIVADVTAAESWLQPPTMNTGVISYARDAKILGQQIVVLVAFDRATRTLKFANSWGPSWGDNGFGTMSAAVAHHVLGEMRAIEIPPA